jgi:hypothetical protein
MYTQRSKNLPIKATKLLLQRPSLEGEFGGINGRRKTSATGWSAGSQEDDGYCLLKRWTSYWRKIFFVGKVFGTLSMPLLVEAGSDYVSANLA